MRRVAHKPRDERLAARALAEVQVAVDEGLLLAADFAGQGDVDVIRRAAIAPDEGQLVAREQVGQRLRRVDRVEHDAADVQLDVGQHRRADLVVQAGDFFVDPFGRADVGRRAAMIAHQRVEQEGVHVVADAEGEQADVAAGAAFTLSRMVLVSVSPSVAKPSVRNRMVVGRSASAMSSAVVSAPLMSVPPSAYIPLIQSIASARRAGRLQGCC